ncbi:elongation factor P hydroxylase [Aliiglaciecola sp. LCG003]|uniref:elongation factor P hydroxylase n=1 Tax=Aliiglaciecola sp. LCG003 TaxID=3053655 RepID=UPI0025741681|nr:elongation factor P hydroxylase [Aliiglaciecola sp. LCG003]WJG08304.1 elongation factor P hydroxylase [Aliiglaciecola sp. LCG003]
MAVLKSVVLDLAVHRYQDLVDIFNQTFYQSENTRLVKGDSDPVYLPASAQCGYHQVVFANGFYASALHEIAHWCIAGKARRQLEDYGYWYCPDGRDAQQQRQFEMVEVKPQAIEWAFSLAVGFPFQVSTDNLNGAQPDRQAFAQNVRAQLGLYQTYGLPKRADLFVQALDQFYPSPARRIEQNLPLEISL